MKYLAMFLEILGNALFALIGFCIICGIVAIVVCTLVDIYHRVDTGSDYLSNLTRKTFKKYSFTPGEKVTFKDKWKDLK